MVNYDAALKPPFPLAIDDPIPFGTKSGLVCLVQELLCLQGIYTFPDGSFGPATLGALQKHFGALLSHSISIKMFADLVYPFTTLQEGARELSEAKTTAEASFIYWARLHLDKHPCEVGGQNMGPWVRLYTRGHQGVNYPWCMAFVSYILFQTCYAMGTAAPIPYSLSCEATYMAAKKKNRLRTDPMPGCIFLLRDANGHHMHAGIVEKVPNPHAVITIEGNTNDDGSREGYKVCRRSRTINRLDFVWPW